MQSVAYSDLMSDYYHGTRCLLIGGFLCSCSKLLISRGLNFVSLIMHEMHVKFVLKQIMDQQIAVG